MVYYLNRRPYLSTYLEAVNVTPAGKAVTVLHFNFIDKKLRKNTKSARFEEKIRVEGKLQRSTEVAYNNLKVI